MILFKNKLFFVDFIYSDSVAKWSGVSVGTSYILGQHDGSINIQTIYSHHTDGFYKNYRGVLISP